MTTSSPESEDHFVLTLDAVRRSITTLKPLSIHESFPAYLHLRHRARDLGQFTDLQPDWQGEVSDWLTVPGGPSNKPFFRPFTSRGSKPDSFWLNDNLAGSYAPSSLRGLRALYVDPQGKYVLPTNSDGLPDPDPIRQKLLFDRPVPAWAVAAFLFRNYRFIAAGEDPGPGWEALMGCFYEHFEWTVDEIDKLFNLEVPEFRAFEREMKTDD